MLINLLVFVLVAGVIYYIFTLVPLPQPFKNIALIVLAIILLLWLLGGLGGYHNLILR